jgi:hypothetical protein
VKERLTKSCKSLQISLHNTAWFDGAAGVGSKQVVFELRELPCSAHRRVAHQ